MTMQLLGAVIVMCVGYFLGMVVYEQMKMLAEKKHRQKIREELDRLYKD